MNEQEMKKIIENNQIIIQKLIKKLEKTKKKTFKEKIIKMLEVVLNYLKKERGD